MRVPPRSAPRLVAAPVLASLSLMALAACGGSDGDKTAPDALDREQLRAALLTQAELPQGWRQAGGGEEVQDDEIAQADRSACQPLLDLVSGRADKIDPTGQADAGLLG